MKQQTPGSSDPHYQIRKLLSMPASSGIVRRHRWANEGNRWQELISALLSECLDMSPAEINAVTQRLRLLKLLEVESWAELPSNLDEAMKSSVARRAIVIFKEHGLDEKQAYSGAHVIYEASQLMKEKFDSRIQAALRASGARVVADFQQSFQLSALSKAQTRRALSVWLQNVLNLPVSIGADSFDAFCNYHGFSATQLTAAADELNVNLAALDDLIEYWSQTAEGEAALHKAKNSK